MNSEVAMTEPSRGTPSQTSGRGPLERAILSLLAVAIWSAAAAISLSVLFTLNAYFYDHLVHEEDEASSINRVKARLHDCAKAVALDYKGPELYPRALGQYLRAVSLSKEKARRLIAGRALLVPVNQLARYNPYPPLLEQIRNEPIRYYFSFACLGKDERFYQVTQYQGETDTLPSLLVEKTRGEKTLFGDRFVTYTVFSSGDPLKQRVLNLQGEGAVSDPLAAFPNIDRIDWNSYAGGSYDAVGALRLICWATIVEGILIYVSIVSWAFRRHWKRAKRHLMVSAEAQ